MLINELKIAATSFCSLTGWSRSAVSVAIYGPNDRNRIKRVFDGFDMKTANFDLAMHWFSANWPEGAEWPAGVTRPQIESASGGGAGVGSEATNGGANNNMEPAE